MKTFVEYHSLVAAEQIACDEALFRLAEAGECGECVRIYELQSPAVVMGVSGRFREEARADICERDKVPLLRRISGGGTVLLGSGSLAYTLVLDMGQRPELRSLRTSYAAPLKMLADALAQYGIYVGQAGISDLAVDGKKIGGSAQKRGKRFILFHGTLLCGLDISLVERYLRMPADQPDYRGGRPHELFVQNLAIGKEHAVDAIEKAFQFEDSTPPSAKMLRNMESMIVDLKREKYTNPGWNLRR